MKTIRLLQINLHISPEISLKFSIVILGESEEFYVLLGGRGRRYHLSLLKSHIITGSSGIHHLPWALIFSAVEKGYSQSTGMWVMGSGPSFHGHRPGWLSHLQALKISLGRVTFIQSMCSWCKCSTSITTTWSGFWYVLRQVSYGSGSHLLYLCHMNTAIKAKCTPSNWGDGSFFIWDGVWKAEFIRLQIKHHWKCSSIQVASGSKASWLIFKKTVPSERRFKKHSLDYTSIFPYFVICQNNWEFW